MIIQSQEDDNTEPVEYKDMEPRNVIIQGQEMQQDRVRS